MDLDEITVFSWHETLCHQRVRSGSLFNLLIEGHNGGIPRQRLLNKIIYGLYFL